MTEIVRCTHGRPLTKRCWRCTVATEKGLVTEAERNQHGTVAWTLFARGVWPRCRCGLDPHDNTQLAAHYAKYGFREVDDHGQIVRFAL